MVDTYQVQQAYKQVVGDLIARLTASVRFQNGVLYVRILSAALRHEMTMRQQSLLDKINDHLCRNVVQSIVFL